MSDNGKLRKVEIRLAEDELRWLDSIKNKTYPSRAHLIRSMLQTIREADEDWRAGSAE